MAKKSNMTSHVLNLLTNRTGLTVDDLESSVSPKEKNAKKQFEATDIKPTEDSAAVEITHVEQEYVEKEYVEERHVERAPVKIAVNLSEKIRINLEKIEMLERTNNTEGG